MTTTQAINSLQPGQQVILSKMSKDGQLIAERSGNGQKLTIFRQMKNGSFTVVSVQKF